MTLMEWRTNKRKLKAAMGILESDIMQDMLSVLTEEGRTMSLTLSFGPLAKTDDHSRMLGRIEGYNLFLENLRRLGQEMPMATPIEANYRENPV